VGRSSRCHHLRSQDCRRRQHASPPLHIMFSHAFQGPAIGAACSTFRAARYRLEYLVGEDNRRDRHAGYWAGYAVLRRAVLDGATARPHQTRAGGVYASSNHMLDLQEQMVTAGTHRPTALIITARLARVGSGPRSMHCHGLWQPPVGTWQRLRRQAIPCNSGSRHLSQLHPCPARPCLSCIIRRAAQAVGHRRHCLRPPIVIFPRSGL
jgi:hypothetical protein